MNLFVAGFIGSPAMNLITGTLARDDAGTTSVSVGSQRLIVHADVLAARPALAGYDGRPLIVGIRPEDLYDTALEDAEPAEGAVLRAEADLVEAMGSEVLVHVSVDAPPAVTEDVQELARDVGAEDHVPDAGAAHSELVARFGPRTRVREGSTVVMRVATDRLHFFDPESGLSITEDV